MDLPRVGRMSPAANTVLIAVNPSAGKGSRRHLTDQLASRLTEQDFQVRFVQIYVQLPTYVEADEHEPRYPNINVG